MKPTVSDLSKIIVKSALGLDGAMIETIDTHNHLIYQITKQDGRVYVLRMTNPDSYRRSEWIQIGEEFEILRALERRGLELGPKVYSVHESQGFGAAIIQEFVEATCFNQLLINSRHLRGAAHAIARLNMAGLNASELPFLDKYKEYSMTISDDIRWYGRLLDTLRRNLRTLKWVSKVGRLVLKAQRKLRGSAELFANQPWVFHFDGAHAGNTYWRDNRVVFLDWQKVSLRNDPTFTLVRLMTSIPRKGEVVNSALFEQMVSEYLKINPIPNFREMAQARLLEREVSDLVWILWDYTRQKNRQPVEEVTSIVARYENLKNKLSF